MLNLSKSKTKIDSYPQTNEKRVRYTISLPESNSRIIDKLADDLCYGNKSLTIKMLLYCAFGALDIKHTKEI